MIMGQNQKTGRLKISRERVERSAKRFRNNQFLVFAIVEYQALGMGAGGWGHGTKGAKCVIDEKAYFQTKVTGLLQQYLYTMPFIDENTQFWGLHGDKKTIQTRGASTYLQTIWEVDKRIVMI